MKRGLFIGTVAAMSIILVSGCRSVEQSQKAPEKRNQVREQGGKIIRAVAEQDFSNYLHHAGERGSVADEAGFLRSCRDMVTRLGKITKFTFLTELDTPEFTNLIYVADFVKSGERGKEVKHHQLIQLIFGEVDGRSKLMGIRVM